MVLPEKPAYPSVPGRLKDLEAFGGYHFSGDQGPSKRKCQAQLHWAMEEIRFSSKFCHWFTVLGCSLCTPHYNSSHGCPVQGMLGNACHPGTHRER